MPVVDIYGWPNPELSKFQPQNLFLSVALKISVILTPRNVFLEIHALPANDMIEMKLG